MNSFSIYDTMVGDWFVQRSNLAGMITGQFDGEVFAKYLWNKKLMDYFNADPERFASNLGEKFHQQIG